MNNNEKMSVPIDEETRSEFDDLAARLEMNDEQKNGVWEWITACTAELVDEIMAANDRECDETERALRTKFGRDYDRKMNGAAELVRRYGGEETVAFMKKSGLCNNLELLTFLMALADAAAEDRGLVGEKSAPVSSVDKLKGEIAALMANPAYMQAGHPDHDRTVNAVFALRKRMFNEE